MPPFNPEALRRIEPTVSEAALLRDIQEKRKQVRETINEILPTPKRQRGSWETPRVTYEVLSMPENRVMQTWLTKNVAINAPEDRYSTSLKLFCQEVEIVGEEVTPQGEEVLVYELDTTNRIGRDREFAVEHHTPYDRLEYLGNVLDTLEVLAEGSTPAA